MIFIFSQAYPSEDNKYAMSYVHSRNLFYLKSGVKFKVVCFAATENYFYENIEVLTKANFEEIASKENNFIVISHAPNLKNHIQLINKYRTKIDSLIFIFHGHEVLKVNRVYPSPYKFKKTSMWKKVGQELYDNLKLIALKKVIKWFEKKDKIDLVFVSDWMRREALHYLGLNEISDQRIHIINNNANENFISEQYAYEESEKKGDFITIRPLDDSKYAIDLVCKLAEKNKEFSFHIYGKGEYFKYFNQPENVVVFNTFINQRDIPKLLNCYRAALMPTRLDAQGVMMCEMASYGIPLITTDLEVCREMLSDFENVYRASDEVFEFTDLNLFLNTHFKKHKIKKFSSKNTTVKEIKLLESRIQNV